MRVFSTTTTTAAAAGDVLGLKIWHLAAAALHTLSFIVLVILLATGPTSSWPVTIPSYTGLYLNWEARYNIGWLLVTFPALSTLNHLSYAALEPYQAYVWRTHTNPLRWAEYAVSAGAMTWVIATLSGVMELRSLVSLGILNFGLQYVGYLVEKCYAVLSGPYLPVGASASAALPLAVAAAYPHDITRVGWLIFLAMWVQIGTSFFSVIEYDTVQKPPDVVYAIVIVLFVLFSTFGVLQLAYVSGRVREFRTYELGFIVLSFVSKTTLTWMVYGGVINAGTNMRSKP